MALTLSYHPLSSFCQKVLIALYENGSTFEKKLVDLGDPAQRADLVARWPFGKFPLLRDSARGLDLPESSIIIEYLERHAAGPRPLIPADAEQALEVRLWDRIFDSYVEIPMQQLVADRRRGGGGQVDGWRQTLRTAYGLAEQRMTGRTWAAGDDFSLADCAAFPGLFYASAIEPFPPGAQALPAYFERLVERPSVARVISEARPYYRYFPFAEGLAPRFL